MAIETCLAVMGVVLGVLGIIGSGLAIAFRLGGLAKTLKRIEENELPHIQKRIDKLRCPEHMEELAIHSTKIEAMSVRLDTQSRRLDEVLKLAETVTGRLELAERRINGSESRGE